MLNLWCLALLSRTVLQFSPQCTKLSTMHHCIWQVLSWRTCLWIAVASRTHRQMIWYRSYSNKWNLLPGSFDWNVLFSTWQFCERSLSFLVPAGSPSCGGDVAIYYFWHKPTELAHSFFFCSCVCFCLYGPFNCISFHNISRQLSAFSHCSFGLSWTEYLFMTVSFSPDIILCGWLSLRHQLTNCII